MALTPGTRLGPYEVTAQIGEGGMGQVWRARDTKLHRDVALKILPDSFAHDADRLARFTREAQTLAALNHPNIAAIYGLDESGGMTALVMELVEGDDLSRRIGGGAIPIEEALPIAKQIAEALEAAHEQGIIHRDLKPANIKVRPDGMVKVLDFGLAKALEPTSTAGTNATASPTVMSPAMTGVGMLLGTAAYMSPEQARAKAVDKRSDIWAFGCVLYEMLTGRRAFDGEDVGDMLANVLKREPDFSVLPAGVPSSVRTLLQRCLVKDRRQRIADVAAALFVLDHQTGVAASSTASIALVPLPPLWRRSIPLAAGLFVGALLAGPAVWLLTRPPPPPVGRIMLTTSGSAALSRSGPDRDVAITPDGSRIVYRGNNQLLVRAVSQLEPSVLGGLGSPRGVFVSPDGHSVGFFDGFTIKKVAITGGPPVTVCAFEGVPRGATWAPDDAIIFATNAPATGLQRVSAAGGAPTLLTKPDRERGEGDHFWPEFLPGGEAVLFTITAPVDTGSIQNAQIAVLDLQTGTSKVLIRGGSHAHYVPTGHLVYGATGTLRAVAFDLGRLEVVGTPATVLEGVVTTPQGAADVAVAANGSLVYVPGVGGVGDQRTVVSVDRQGRTSPLPGLPLNSYRDVRVSPDGRRVALATQADVWTYDVARETLSRLTTDSASGRSPLWTPDGQRIIFTSRRAAYPELFWRAADGSGSDERLLTRANDLLDLLANGWSADGTQLLFTEVPPNIRCAIGEVAIERPSDAKLLLTSDYCNEYSAMSPDGHSMAYESNVSGRREIYVERYPELGNRQQISTDGGQLPLWSRDGRELFFGGVDGRQMFAVRVQSGTTLVAGRPQVLFDALAANVSVGGSRTYDMAPDGRFFVIRRGPADADVATASNIILVQNWFEELKRLVPTN